MDGVRAPLIMETVREALADHLNSMYGGAVLIINAGDERRRKLGRIQRRISLVMAITNSHSIVMIFFLTALFLLLLLLYRLHIIAQPLPNSKSDIDISRNTHPVWSSKGAVSTSLSRCLDEGSTSSSIVIYLKQ